MEQVPSGSGRAGEDLQERRFRRPAGDTHHAAGEEGPARTAWTEALTILDGLRHPDAESIRLKPSRMSG